MRPVRFFSLYRWVSDTAHCQQNVKPWNWDCYRAPEMSLSLPKEPVVLQLYPTKPAFNCTWTSDRKHTPPTPPSGDKQRYTVSFFRHPRSVWSAEIVLICYEVVKLMLFLWCVHYSTFDARPLHPGLLSHKLMSQRLSGLIHKRRLDCTINGNDLSGLCKLGVMNCCVKLPALQLFESKWTYPESSPPSLQGSPHLGLWVLRLMILCHFQAFDVMKVMKMTADLMKRFMNI